MTTKRTYRFLIGIIILVFVLPLAQRNLNIWQFDALKGEHYPHQKPAITLPSWLDGSYQIKMDKYCADSFGFQSPMVRSINQVDFTLFKQANAQYVVIGENNYLYETPYIEAHLGMDLLDDSTIQTKLDKYKAVHDTLKALGVNLTMVFAPGKGSYFPEYIPNYYLRYKAGSTNYVEFIKGFHTRRLPHIDMSAWFRSMKNNAPAPLMCRTGIHWSKYGMVVASDSLLQYWNVKYDNKLPYLTCTLPDTTTTITTGSDADVEDGLNIYQKLEHFEMVYPNYVIQPRTEKIKTVVIADSYFWGLFDIGLSTVASDSGEFWYYFKQVYPQNFTTGLMVDDIDLQKEVESNHEILLLQTDATLDRFGFGFVEAVYDLYY